MDIKLLPYIPSYTLLKHISDSLEPKKYIIEVLGDNRLYSARTIDAQTISQAIDHLLKYTKSIKRNLRRGNVKPGKITDRDDLELYEYQNEAA
jgi:hypothetical protein